MDAPIAEVSTFSGPFILGPLHVRGAQLHRLDDIVVAGAAAEVAVEPRAYRFLRERLAVALHQIDGTDHHAGCAKSALQAVTFLERRLHRMHLTVRFADTFDGCYLRTAALHRERHAGFDGVAVYEHRARAALAGVAADVRAGKI